MHFQWNTFFGNKASMERSQAKSHDAQRLCITSIYIELL